jgi:hypothetical protein
MKYAFLLILIFLSQRGFANEVSLKTHCDIPGNNLSSENMKTPESCQKKCLETKACLGFTFISGWNRCFLKKKIKQQNPLRFYSGYFKTVDGLKHIAEEAYDIDYPKYDLKKISPVKNPKECKEHCLKEEKCVAFGYLEGYLDCWLKDKLAKKQTKIFYCGVKK